jgi:hypothetical protein
MIAAVLLRLLYLISGRSVPVSRVPTLSRDLAVINPRDLVGLRP